MSGEIQADVADAYRTARLSVQKVVNGLLGDINLAADIEELAFVAIIRTEDHPDYNEIVKQHRKDKSIECRLKINHTLFLHATARERECLVVEALRHCVDEMRRFGVGGEDINKLKCVLDAV